MAERVLVAGATGTLGRELVLQLKERGYIVRALGRDPAKLKVLCPLADERIVLDAVQPADLRSVCEGMEQAVSCLGASVIPAPQQGRTSFTGVDTPANLNLIRAAQAERVRRFVYLSVFTDGRLRENDFVRGHEDVVEALRASELDYVVVRSTGFFASLVQIMREPIWGLLPQHRSGEARTNPIHEADLAEFCANLLQETGARLEYSVGGPEALTRRQIADLVLGSDNNGRPVLPVASLRAGSFVLRPFNRRVSQLLEFIAEVLSGDFVAPPFGSRTLAQYLSTENAPDATVRNRRR